MQTDMLGTIQDFSIDFAGGMSNTVDGLPEFLKSFVLCLCDLVVCVVDSASGVLPLFCLLPGSFSGCWVR
jgi:hypothetical protein